MASVFPLLFSALCLVAAGLPADAETAEPPASPPLDSLHPWSSASDEAAAVKELQDVSLAGMDRRLGPDYAAYHQVGVGKKFPEIYLAPSKIDPGGRRYQIGGPWSKEGGDFSSTQGQVLYVPDDPAAFPMDRVNVEEWSNGVFSERPEPPWNGGFRPDPVSQGWLAAAGGKPGQALGIARGYGGWSNCGVAIFSSGLAGAVGTVTARGTEPVFQFPPNKIPLAVSVTNKSEFALVTVHDSNTHRGQVAVLSIGVNGKKTGFVHEWPLDAWSLPSVGLITGLKLLGYIDLPSIKFPTGVCAVGNEQGSRMSGRDGNAGLLREYNIATQADRDIFFKGNNAGFSSTAGFAVVISKYENKAAFLDLQPLFQRVRESYFTDEAHFQKTADSGPAPNQWPYTFEAEPSWKPPVISEIEVAQPVSVIASLAGGAKDARTLIASLDGRVGVYRVGGLASDGPADAKEIVRVSETQIGRNPTCLAYLKGTRDGFLACSRGDREIAWLKLTPAGLEVSRRLRDARLLDPVNLEMSDTHGVETGLLTVADFHGRQVLNYRFERVVFATQGGAKFDMGPDGKDPFECGGVLEFPGSPICISASNVN